VTWIKEHKLIFTSILVCVICLGFLGVIVVDMIDKKAVSSSPVVSKEDSTSNSNNDQKSESTAAETITDNPFGGKNSSMTEDEVLNYMHGMSHQKVEAEEKWLHFEMTNERIQFLIGVVESGRYENSDLYLDILNRWAEGDFLKADKDHNAIWNLQGGTIGKATGVLSTEEEKQYLEDNQGSIQ
jgi:hypothetical protein